MIKPYFAFLVFFAGGLLFNEMYPFTRFPMYNEFPNYSYVFYLRDTEGHPIPLRQLRMGGGELAHNYFAIANALQLPNGENLETQEHLALIGKKMAQIIRQKNPKFVQRFQIHRLYFYKQKNQLKKQDRVIFTTPKF
jgi:hypothetical protein